MYWNYELMLSRTDSMSSYHWNSLRYTNGRFQRNYAHNQNMFWLRHISLSDLWSVFLRLEHFMRCISMNWRRKRARPALYHINGGTAIVRRGVLPAMQDTYIRYFIFTAILKFEWGLTSFNRPAMVTSARRATTLFRALSELSGVKARNEQIKQF